MNYIVGADNTQHEGEDEGKLLCEILSVIKKIEILGVLLLEPLK